ncbi:MAG: SDR family NAD(P)-dependent oxidoreductase [Microbacteriaceae bacterium]
MTALAQFDLGGRVIGVTGAGKGIGRAIALRAVESGARVFACARTADDLVDLQTAVGGLDGSLAHVALDMTEPGAPERFIAFGQQRFGGVDGLVNNIGLNVVKPALDFSADELDLLYTVNLRSVYLTCAAAARHMISAGSGGAIVNVTSKAGLVGAPLRAPYSAMKAGAGHLTRTLAAEWAEHGIRVNAVSPGPTATPMLSQVQAGLPMTLVQAQVLLGRRLLRPDELAWPALFLLSDAAAMMTGQILAVDGGSSLTGACSR